MKRIRILFTIPNFDTAGSGRALLNIALALDENRFESHILCSHDRGDFFQVVKNSGIPVHVFEYIPDERPISQLLMNCYKVSRKIKKINPDIVHSFHYAASYGEALAARLSGAKWVFTKKNMSWGGGSKNAWKVRSFLANKIAVQNTDMQKEFYPTSKKTVLIPRGVVIDKFKASQPLPQIREQMETKTNERVLICVANFVPVKGIETLINAFVSIAHQFPDWVLWLVGDDKNEYGQLLHKLVANLNYESKIKFSGKQMNVVDYLNHAEIFVLPTLDKGEGSPVSMLEAMANSKVVLGSRVPGIKDHLKEFPEHLFTPKDEIDLAEKLTKLMKKDRKELKQLGLAFLRPVTENYSIEKEVEGHEQLYLSCIKNNQ
ncbi:glycosyltransferase [Aequorivita sp. 609]|uniref:glycosyltransferase n=1 Tax=Aequorivita TaxID=153265 RepID=UPI0016159A7D|nr:MULTISPECIES: glycosyltransferase [Aequorivita]MBB6681137.1 glycosyltransferase [Aequorivita sp. 609]